MSVLEKNLTKNFSNVGLEWSIIGGKPQEIISSLKAKLEEANKTLKSLKSRIANKSMDVDDFIGKSNNNEDVIIEQINATIKKIEKITGALKNPFPKCLCCKKSLPLEQLEEVPEATVCPECIKMQQTQH